MLNLRLGGQTGLGVDGEMRTPSTTSSLRYGGLNGTNAVSLFCPVVVGLIGVRRMEVAPVRIGW